MDNQFAEEIASWIWFYVVKKGMEFNDALTKTKNETVCSVKSFNLGVEKAKSLTEQGV